MRATHEILAQWKVLYLKKPFRYKKNLTFLTSEHPLFIHSCSPWKIKNLPGLSIDKNYQVLLFILYLPNLSKFVWISVI